MNVDVDKARADDTILRVDHHTRLRAVQSIYCSDPIAANGNVCAKRGTAAAAVNDGSVTNDTVELHALTLTWVVPIGRPYCITSW